MVRLKSSALKHYIVSFTDHAGRPAKMTWTNSPRNILIPLASICFYFVHPHFSLDDLDMKQFSRYIRDGDADLFRFEIFHVPGASNADCAQHYATWKHEDEEQSFDVVEFDPALTPDDYSPGELEIIGPQPPFKTTRMSAKRKAKVLRYEDQGVWLWFVDHRSSSWWGPTTISTSEAQSMGWMSWQ